MKRGQSLLEVVLAVAIFAMAMAGAGALFRSQFVSESSSARAARAAFLADEALDAARIIRDRNWFELRPSSYGLDTTSSSPTLVSGSDTEDGFTRTISITEIDETTREVEVTVSWNEGALRSRRISLRTRLTDWWALGRDGAWGDWSNPTLNEPNLDLGAEGTGVAVRDGIAYLSVASSSNEPDFHIIDVSNPQAPNVLSSLSIPGNNRGTDDVAISGNYAYLASRDDDFVLHIVDISDPASPTLISSLAHPEEEAAGRTAAVSGNYAYLGTEQVEDEDPGEEEFLVVDISNPSAPYVAAGVEFDNEVQDIAITGNYVYVAASEDIYGELVVIDISNPLAPTVVTDLDPAGSHSGYGISLWADDNLASFVRWRGNPEFFILDISDLANPLELGSARSPEHYHKTLLAHPIAYAAGTHNNEELVIYDISNPNSPQEIAAIDLRSNAEGMDFARNHLYVAVRSSSRPLAILTAN